MIGSVLVANRGEIAVRLIRTYRALELRTIAVYSDADALALHVRLADEARRLGPAPVTASYLNQDALLAAARDAGAETVDPGYGLPLSRDIAIHDHLRRRGEPPCRLFLSWTSPPTPGWPARNWTRSAGRRASSR